MTNYTDITKQYLAREAEMRQSKRSWQFTAFSAKHMVNPPRSFL